MRSIGLIIIGSFAAACGGPSAESSAEAGPEVEEKVAGQNEGALSEQAEPQSPPEANSTGTNVQGEPANPCEVQVSEPLQVAPIRAVGTEPFWAAKVQGRCVTYSTPENQQGVRVWTRYSDGGDGRSAWVGQLGGKPFEMRVRPEAGCSDGMSDKRYPMAVDLMVNGEKRKGCAELL